ncbi:MAG: tetratricopeptide repeat protein [Alphaproteobacteria bacterium]|nr:tetratricopeptide repeat protein [Alphaproteobacteria bacterium]
MTDDARSGLGATLRAAARAVRAGHLEAAVALYRRAADAAPADWSTHYNLGTLLLGLGRPAEAAVALRAAIARDAERPEPHATLAMALLGVGDEEAGWREYLWRREAPRLPAARPRAALPDRLDGERVAVLNEQGLGDALFFLRYAAALAARGATVVHDPFPKLAPILDRVPWLARPTAPPDRRLPLGDLPFLVAAHRSDPHPPALALSAPPRRRAAVARRLAEIAAGPWLGATWRAGVRAGGALFKEVPPARLGAALRSWPGPVAVLQRAPRPDDVAAFQAGLGRPVVDLSALNERLEDMLAVLDCLAEHVGVSSTNVHLRAGLGRPSRVLVPWPAEFRWRAGAERSPWFPDSPTYRQGAGGDWAAALERLAEDVSAASGA